MINQKHMKHLSFLLSLVLICSTQSLMAQEEEYGLASYYSDDFQGRSTAYGETYDKDQLTCAHKRYPYGTMLRVTRLDTKKSVNVKVTDKGPFIKGRVVDLSRRAAEILGIIGQGAVEVKVEKVTSGSSRAADVAPEPAPVPDRPVASPRVEEDIPAAASTSPERRPEPEVVPEPEPEVRPARPVEEVAEETPITSQPIKTETRVTDETVRTKPDRNALVGDDYTTYGLYRIVLERPGKNANYGVQVASFSNYENVLQKVADLQAKWFDNILVSIEPGTNGSNAYKVILGPFSDQKTAQHYQESLRSRYRIKGFVLELSGLKN